MMRMYQHKKTGNPYLRLAVGMFKSNKEGEEDFPCIIYCPVDKENTIYVRSEEGWYNSFTEWTEEMDKDD